MVLPTVHSSCNFEGLNSELLPMAHSSKVSVRRSSLSVVGEDISLFTSWCRFNRCVLSGLVADSLVGGYRTYAQVVSKAWNRTRVGKRYTNNSPRFSL